MAATPQSDAPQRVSISRYVLFAAIAVVGAGLDLWTKHWAFEFLGFPRQGKYWIVENVFSLDWTLNRGALFGSLQGWVPLFVVLSLAAAIGIFYWLFVAKAARDLLLTVALAGVMAGIIGNLYDRVGLPGLTWPYPTATTEVGEPVYAVRDWIHVQYYESFDWPLFNLADSFLVVSAFLLVWHSFRGDLPRKQAAEAATSAPANAAR